MCYATGQIPCSLECEAHGCAYEKEKGMRFGDVINGLWVGKKFARNGWNGKGMFIYLVEGSTFAVNRPPLLGIYSRGKEISYRPHIDMQTADGQCVPWVASQSDILADDWWVAQPSG